MVLITITLLCAGLFIYREPTSWEIRVDYTPLTSKPKTQNKPPKFNLLFAGDIMLNRGVEAKARQAEDFRWSFLQIASTTRKADLFFANLESVISNQGRNIGSKYSFRADPGSLEGLEYAGVDVLSVANNHSGDWTISAFKDSLERLTKANISFCGGSANQEEAYDPAYYDLKNTRIAFLCYTDLGPEAFKAAPQSGGFAWTNSEIMKVELKRLSELKNNQKPDIIVVSMHFGQEYKKEPSERQEKLARQAIDYGADLVVGHHPHVVQNLVQYKNGWIAYSLGNFVFDQLFSTSTRQGVLLDVTIEGGEIGEVKLRKTYITEKLQVILK